jgi:hypothetical protein
MKLKSPDALPVEDESTDVVPSCRVSPLRPYVSSPNANSFNSSNHSQLSTPGLDLVANCPPLNESGCYASLEVGDTPSKYSNISEKQVELAIFCDDEAAPSANGPDFSGETFVEDAALPATRKEW